MKTVLMSHLLVGGNETFRGFVEVSERGILYFDNYRRNKESLKRLADTFLDNYIEYVEEARREGLRNSINNAYESATDADFSDLEDAIIDMYDYFSTLSVENVQFSTVVDEIPKLITLEKNGNDAKEFNLSYLGRSDHYRYTAEAEDFEDNYRDIINEVRTFYEDNVSDFDDLDIDIVKIVNTRRNIKYYRKALAVLAAGVVLTSGFVGAAHFIKKNNDNNKTVGPTRSIEMPTLEATVEVEPTIETTLEPEISLPTAEPVVSIPTQVPTVEPGPTPHPFYFENPSTDPSVVSYVLESYGDEPHTIYEERFNNVDEMIIASNDNMSDLANCIYNFEEWKGKHTLGITIDFEKYFPNCSEYEIGFIKYFSDMRNDVIYHGFRTLDYNEAINCNRFALTEVLKYVRDNEPLNVNLNGTPFYVTFSELSPEAQNIIRNIAWGFYILQDEDIIVYNGQEYTNDMIALEVFGIQPDHPQIY